MQCEYKCTVHSDLLTLVGGGYLYIHVVKYYKKEANLK